MLAAAIVCGCGNGSGERTERESAPMTLTITSSAFAAGEAIPSRHTCEGENLSPPLRWSGVPPGARSLALICDDPDAPVGTWVHWVLYAVPPALDSLPEGVAKTETVLGARQGVNDFHRVGYGGPCPPPGKAHRYFFRLYALDAPIDLAARAGRKDVDAAMQGHVIAQGELMGTYRRDG
jgi:Raf kinase inhibitor-like YbhB/YbcL family protein